MDPMGQGKPYNGYMGVSFNGGTPISHLKMLVFSRKTPWFLGKPTILGNRHIGAAIIGLDEFIPYNMETLGSLDLIEHLIFWLLGSCGS